MNTSHPHLTDTGVAFTVYVDYVPRDCLISTEALNELSELGAGDPDLMETFRAYEANINGIARRLVAAGVQSKPVRLGKQNFQNAERRRVQ